MKRFLFVALFFVVLSACSKDTPGTPDPEPPVPPVKPGDISLEFSAAPDSVQLGKTAEFTFKVKQQDQLVNLSLSVDTVGAFNMSIGGASFKDVKSVAPDDDNKVTFTPNKEGMCKVSFTVSDKAGKSTKKELSIKAYATATTVTIGALASDSIRLGETAGFTLTINQDGHAEAFKILTEFSGKGALKINGSDYHSVKTILPGVGNNIAFTPSEIGSNKITFTLTDKFGKSTKQDVSLRCFFPEVKISVSGVPEKVAVETAADFTFQVNGTEGEEYALSIDTVIPVLDKIEKWNEIIDLEGEGRRGVELSINGQPLTSVKTVKSGVANTFRFANPQVIGDYKITFNVTDKFSNTTKKEVLVKAHSPKPVTITFYETDPWIELDIDRKHFYEVLNERYTYNPLSSVFVGKEVNYIYSKERPKPGFPGSWTIPGRGITAYVAQEGGKEFYYVLHYDTDISTLSPEWDGENKYWGTILKQGFHALEFFTSQYERVGITEYILSVYDYWGKETTSKITINALSRTETMPAHGELR